MRILGVDPGLRVTGYGLIEVRTAASRGTPLLIEAGVIRTGARDGIAERLRKVHDSLCGLLDDEKPDVIVIEKLYAHYNHPTTAILMAHARGVVCLLAGRYGIPLAGIAPTHVKKAVTGHGHAGKAQIQRMIQHELGLKRLPEPPDVADALAIAIAYAGNKR